MMRRSVCPARLSAAASTHQNVVRNVRTSTRAPSLRDDVVRTLEHIFSYVPERAVRAQYYSPPRCVTYLNLVFFFRFFLFLFLLVVFPTDPRVLIIIAVANRRYTFRGTSKPEPIPFSERREIRVCSGDHAIRIQSFRYRIAVCRFHVFAV